MRNLLLKISYDGKRYHGWQVQQNAVTVQEVFQTALKAVLGIQPALKGCSRTDAGVHAYAYYISMQLEHPIPEPRLIAALNRFLPPDIAVQSCVEVPQGFHARYSCIGKEYVYKLWNHAVRDPFLDGYAYHYRYPLNEALLNCAAQQYVGAHDFTSFCTLDQRKAGSLVRCVTNAAVTRSGDTVLFTVAADGFLYNMVRIMVGTLLRVAQGKFQPEEIPKILSAKNRQAAGPTAPACGLYLNRVFYPKEIVTADNAFHSKKGANRNGSTQRQWTTTL